MTTAQVLFEQYKVLPKRIQRELKAMIDKEDGSVPVANLEDDDDENGDTIRISMKALKDSIGEIKKLKAGKQKGRPVDELFAEMRREEQKH